MKELQLNDIQDFDVETVRKIDIEDNVWIILYFRDLDKIGFHKDDWELDESIAGIIRFRRIRHERTMGSG